LVILVVEDDNFTRSLILSILRGLGVRTALEAADAGSALEQLTDGEVDVIVSDIEMHPVNGLELLRHLRTGSRPAGVVPPRAPAFQIPVIFLTAHAKAKLVEQARAAGVSAFLTKPIRPALLRDRIMSVAAQVRRNGSNPGAAPASAAEAGTDIDGKPQEGAAGQLARIMHVISHFFVVLYGVSTSGRALASPAAAAGLDDFGGLRLTT